MDTNMTKAARLLGELASLAKKETSVKMLIEHYDWDAAGNDDIEHQDDEGEEVTQNVIDAVVDSWV